MTVMYMYLQAFKDLDALIEKVMISLILVVVFSNDLCGGMYFTGIFLEKSIGGGGGGDQNFLKSRGG